MKKTRLIAVFTPVFTFLLLNSAYASAPYIGFDLLHASAKHRARNFSGDIDTVRNGEKRDGSNTGYSVNLGYRIDAAPSVVFAEFFYDNLNIDSDNFHAPNGTINAGDKINVKNRYGAKLNAGLTFIPGIAPYVSYGLSNVRYDNNLGGDKVSKTEFSPLYGFGLLVDLPTTDLALRLSYDLQRYTMEYAGEKANIRTYVSVVKLGVMYKF